jgi:hypothetical protein
MLTGKTSSGFEYSISDEALSDWEVLEALTEIDDGHYSAAVRVVNLLFDKEQKKALMEHCRDKKTGRVPQKNIFTELSEILTGSGSDDEKAKNA